MDGPAAQLVAQIGGELAGKVLGDLAPVLGSLEFVLLRVLEAGRAGTSA
jgi:hypothetical protein